MGRKKLLDEEKSKKGTLQPIRANKDTDVVPLSRMPYVPDWICEEGKRIWREQGPNLLRKGLLGEEDVSAFARYCQFAGLFENLMSKLPTDQLIIKGFAGMDVANPRFKLAMDCQVQADKLGRQFGLSPSTRKEVPRPEPKKDDNPLGDLLRSA
jgi:P27 family predicted phage terminase small subunit